MKYLTRFVSIATVFLVVWLSYVAGYDTAFKLGMDRNLSTLYSNSDLQVRILDLLSKNEGTRASNALEAAIRSDISIMKEYENIRSNMSYIDTLRSSLLGFGQDSSRTSTLKIEELGQLESKFENIVSPTSPHLE